jgi:hypothetical protein
VRFSQTVGRHPAVTNVDERRPAERILPSVLPASINVASAVQPCILSLTMNEPFVLGDTNAERWVVHPPQDPYGDGYVYAIATELHEDGMTAATIAKVDGTVEVDGTFAGRVTTLSEFMESLAADWQGWYGIRTWQSLGGELTIDARHDRRGYVSLGMTLRAPGRDRDDTAWSARAVFVLEAGEEMSRLAADLTHFLQT